MGVAIACIILIICFAINLPVFIGVIAAVLSYFYLAPDISPMIAVQRIIGAGENTVLLAIPFFILLGNLLNYAGITGRMRKLAEVLTGHLPGGLAHTNVLFSTLMGGLAVSNMTECALTTRLLVPEMTKLGYSKAFSTAVTAAGSLITPIIPPGIALILYAFVADVSIGKMFMAGFIPGILCCIMLMIAINFVARKRGYKPVRDHRPAISEVFSALKEVSLPFLLAVFIIGGIHLGIITPPEAGALAVVFVFVLEIFVYKKMTLADIQTAVLETILSTAGIMLIIMACSAFSWILSWEQTVQDVVALVGRYITSPYVFLIALNLFLLIVGMFLEGNAVIIVLVPLLMPVVKNFGIDPVQFGLIIILNMAIGCLMPPMGRLMHISTAITGVKKMEFVREMWPLLFALLAVLALVTFVPVLSTFLPNL